MARLLGHRQTKGTETNKLNLRLPRHISTLQIRFHFSHDLRLSCGKMSYVLIIQSIHGVVNDNVNQNTLIAYLRWWLRRWSTSRNISPRICVAFKGAHARYKTRRVSICTGCSRVRAVTWNVWRKRWRTAAISRCIVSARDVGQRCSPLPSSRGARGGTGVPYQGRDRPGDGDAPEAGRLALFFRRL